MDNTFRDSLAVEVGKQIDQMEVLEQEGAILANPLRGFGILHWTAIGGGVHRLLLIPESSRLVVCNHCDGLCAGL